MLAEPDELPSRPRRGTVWWAAGALLGSTAVCWSLMRLGTRHVWPAPATHITDGSVNAIGVSLLTTYCLAFEGISLVLFAAILGALAIARRGRTKP
jgi:NADH-quinone oxidoreductase subunit J